MIHTRSCSAGLAALCLVLALPVAGNEHGEEEALLTAPVTRQQRARATEAWRSLVKLRVKVPEKAQLATAAVERFLATDHGSNLMIELAALLPAGDEPRIVVQLVDELPVSADDYDGYMRPVKAAAELYEVFVWNYPESREQPGSAVLYGQYPGNSQCDIVFWYTEAASSMAHTLFHELLHVWFLNRFHDEELQYPSGHGKLQRCEIDERFLELLRAHALELDNLEHRHPRPLDLHRAARRPPSPGRRSVKAPG